MKVILELWKFGLLPILLKYFFLYKVLHIYQKKEIPAVMRHKGTLDLEYMSSNPSL